MLDAPLDLLLAGLLAFVSYRLIQGPVSLDPPFILLLAVVCVAVLVNHVEAHISSIGEYLFNSANREERPPPTCRRRSSHSVIDMVRIVGRLGARAPQRQNGLYQ